MSANASSHIGEPGTARFRRMWELRGISQTELGKCCRPKMPQGHVSQFENGQMHMSWSLARRLAPGYYPELYAQDDENCHKVAQLLTWRLWFENVACYAPVEIKSYANSIRERIGAEIFTEEKTLWDLIPRSWRKSIG